MNVWLRHARVLFLVLTLGVVGAAAYVSPASADAEVSLTKVIEAGYPGAVGAVRDNGKVSSSAAGIADLASGRKARAGDRYRIGSITKPMTATIVLQLVAERRLSLDSKVAKILPGHGLDARLTIRHLLQQTSGFRTETMVFQPPRSLESNRYRYFRPAELVKIALTNPEPRAVPGTKWEYSNTNYVLAGMVIEKTTDRPYEYELWRRILKPLGMKGTSIPRGNPFITGRHLNGYVEDYPGKPLVDYTVYSPSYVWTAGAVISTVADETRFLGGLLGGRLLPKAQLAAMMDTGEFGYGLGLYPMSAPCVEGGAVWGHNGAMFGYQSAVFGTPGGDRQIAVGANALGFTEAGQINPIVDLTAAGAFCPGAKAPVAPKVGRAG